ncbi:MAG: glycoside hydrolase family 15 protein [Chloroflexota bacterium]
MPRDLPIGNGTLLVNFDSTYTLRDFYYPYVGNENQTLGHRCRMGVWADGTFAWVADDGWTRDLRYVEDTLATDVRLHHSGMGLEIQCTDVVDFHENAMVRRFLVKDLSGADRDVRLFFHHDFHLYENEVGDTAYFDPYSRAVIHYKDHRYILILGGTTHSSGLQTGLSGYATGTKEVNGKEGTWRDAEDGVLGGNPISQGSVDSTVQINVSLPAGGDAEAFLWLAVGCDHEEVTEMNERIISKLPAQLIKRTSNYWRLWANKEHFDYAHCSLEVITQFKRSLLIMRTQVDNHGAIIAANDTDIVEFSRDTYSYMWPRDGALVSYALTLAGYGLGTLHFLNFCERVISRHGYFLHKYNPDGSLASSWHPWVGADGHDEQLPIQEDETALVLWAISNYYEHTRSVDGIKSLFRPVVVAAADFMVGYRDKVSGLPLPSYDLWEERRGVMAFTVGAVYGGLMSAAHLAAAFGETELAARYETTADNIKEAVIENMYDPGSGRFVRMVTPEEDGGYVMDHTIDASLYALWYFGMFSVDDERIVRTMDAVRGALWCDTPVGGLARYENDNYQRVATPPGSPSTPGNPWFVCTMWYAQYLIAAAKDQAGLDKAFELIQWATDRALPSGVMAEQVDPYTGNPLSVSPLTWSHAAYITTILEYLDKHSEMNLCPTCGQPLNTREMPRLREAHTHLPARRSSQGPESSVVNQQQ